MKFLVIYREDTKISTSIPLPAVMEMVEATAGWIDEMRGNGKATEGAFLAPQHGGMIVLDVASHAELCELVESCPAAPICSVETHALVDTKEFRTFFKKQKERALANFEKLAAMMPKK
jgi:hypothetical protein